MNIALTYSPKKYDNSKPPDYFSECDSEETIRAIADALTLRGHSVEKIDAGQRGLFLFFKNKRVDMVFNIAEGRRGRMRESEIPAMLEYLNIPYTGSKTFSLALALNKALAKKVLKAEGIPTPNFQLFVKGSEPLKPELRFPLIVKPNREGSGKGIVLSSVVNGHKELVSQIRRIINDYQQEALVEEFIEGRELTVGILENEKTVILPVLEIDFSGCAESGEYFYSWRMKEFQGNPGFMPSFYCPARIDKYTEGKVKEMALRTHHAIGCLDISRTDIRLNKHNEPFVLEVNPLPGLDPKASNFPMMAYAAGLKYEDLIEIILTSAYKRKGGLN